MMDEHFYYLNTVYFPINPHDNCTHSVVAYKSGSSYRTEGKQMMEMAKELLKVWC